MVSAAPPQGPLAPLRTLLQETRLTLRTYRPELLSSAAARAATVLLLNPLDATKARLQVTHATSPLALRAARTGNPLAGALPAALAHAPAGVLAFVVYARLHATLSRRRLPVAPATAAACLADAVAALWLTPLESAKLRVQTGVSRGAFAALRAPSAPPLWHGLLAQVARDVPFRLLHLALYERARRALIARRPDTTLSPRDGAAVGAVVGAAVGAITTPLDVVRTRVMAQRAAPGCAYDGWLACARGTLVADGAPGLFRGVAQRAVYMGLSVALFSAAYEVAKRSWGERKADVVGIVGARFAKSSAPVRAR